MICYEVAKPESEGGKKKNMADAKERGFRSQDRV